MGVTTIVLDLAKTVCQAGELIKLGHDVKLIAPAYVKPNVKRGKSDAIDAAAICEAVSPLKSFALSTEWGDVLLQCRTVFWPVLRLVDRLCRLSHGSRLSHPV
nr:hypothetical protein [Pseudophaeobacter leonis]